MQQLHMDRPLLNSLSESVSGIHIHSLGQRQMVNIRTQTWRPQPPDVVTIHVSPILAHLYHQPIFP